MIESATGVPSGAALVDDPRLARVHHGQETTSLEGRFPSRPGSKRDLAHAFAATKQLFAAGVPILAGTDAPNPGTAHGVEPASRARAARASRPAGLRRARGRDVGAGARLWPAGPRPHRARPARRSRCSSPAIRRRTSPRRATSSRSGRAAPSSTRTAAPATATAAARAGDRPAWSAVRRRRAAAAFGSGWQTSTDTMMGGKSTAAMTVVKGGANGTRGRAADHRHACRWGRVIRGPAPCSFPAPAPMTPVEPLAVQDARLLGAGRRPRAPGHGLRRPPRQHPGDAVVHGRRRVEGVRDAAGVVLGHRRVRPARRAILRRTDAGRLRVRHRRDQAACNRCDALQAAAPVLASRLDAVRLAGLSLFFLAYAVVQQSAGRLADRRRGRSPRSSALYFRGFWVEGRALLPIAFAIVALGVITAPRNPGASCFFIFGAAFLGDVGRPAVAVRWLLVILAHRRRRTVAFDSDAGVLGSGLRHLDPGRRLEHPFLRDAAQGPGADQGA